MAEVETCTVPVVVLGCGLGGDKKPAKAVNGAGVVTEGLGLVQALIRVQCI